MIPTLHAAIHNWLAANGSSLRDHLVLSTVLLLILLAVVALPSLRSRTRFALILLGVVKFLIPAGIVTVPAASLATAGIALPSFTMIVRPFPDPSAVSEIFCVLAVIWFAGAAIATSRMIVTYLRWRRIVREATAAADRERETMTAIARRSSLRTAPLVMRSSTGLPMTAGLLRPVVLIPLASAGRLDDDELRAVLAHELAHVERRHNLAAAVQNVATALFWFNPALWLANIRLHVEAEKDCDERVLQFVPDPPTYLSGMLKASYGFIAPQPAGVSCMSTSQLKERMDHLMRHHKSAGHAVPHWLAIAAGITAVMITTAFVSGAAPVNASPSAPAAAEERDYTTPPKLISKVDPVYPEAARANRVQGLVIVEATISNQGDVTGVAVAQGIEGDEGKALGEAAMAAVKQWKFEPAKLDGKAVAVKYKVTLNFKLDGSHPKK